MDVEVSPIHAFSGSNGRHSMDLLDPEQPLPPAPGLAAPFIIPAYFIAGTPMLTSILRPRQPHIRLFTEILSQDQVPDLTSPLLTQTMVLIDWLASMVAGDSDVRQPFASMYDDEKDDCNENRAPPQPVQVDVWPPGAYGGRAGGRQVLLVPHHAIIVRGQVLANVGE